MDLDDLLRRHFGASNVAEVDRNAQTGGLEGVRQNFVLERGRSKLSTSWTLLFLSAPVPDLDVSSEDKPDREAARNFMDRLAAAGKC